MNSKTIEASASKFNRVGSVANNRAALPVVAGIMGFLGLGIFLALGPLYVLPSLPLIEPQSHQTPSRLIEGTKVNGLPLTLTRGQGDTWTEADRKAFESLKAQGLALSSFRVQWVLEDLDNEKIVSQSRDPGRLFYGASVSKLFVAAAVAYKFSPQFKPRIWQDLAEMITISSNQAWSRLHFDLGDHDYSRGQLYLQDLVKSWGYHQTKAFRGWNGSDHGNEVNALELAKILADTYHQRYRGANYVWRLMQATRTGVTKGLRYLPQDLLVGGKTGTYTGQTINPQSKKAYFANVHHHALTFNDQGKQYALVVLADQSSDQEVAIMAFGLFQELIK